MERIFSEWQNLAAGKTINHVLKQIGFYGIICCFFFAGNSFMFSDTEKRIKQGIPKISRYFDSLSFQLGDPHVRWYYIQAEPKVKSCENDNFSIVPIFRKADFQFRRYNFYLQYNSRFFLIDDNIASVLVEKKPLSDSLRQGILSIAPAFENITIDYRMALYYLGCQFNYFRITIYSGSDRILEPIDQFNRAAEIK